MSGWLGQIISGFLGSNQPNMGNMLQQVLTQNGGGVSALLDRFNQAGLGEQAQSWVSSGTNQPVSTEQISQVFSPDELEKWAGQIGVNPDQVRSLLAEALPQAVNHVTPDGQVPAGSEMPDLSSLIGKFFR
jgi:uncharacterized protein YidB (DUF937 family)